VTKLSYDLDVRRSTAAIVFLEALLAVPFVLGLAAAFEQPSLSWTLIIPFGTMVGFLVHHMSLILRINDGVLIYRELSRGITRIPLADIEKAYVVGWFTYRDKFTPLRRLVIVPKPSSSVSQFNINTAIFDAGDVERLVRLLPSERT
jgi:hypothetical protein